MEKRNLRKERIGIVTSNKMIKSIVVSEVKKQEVTRMNYIAAIESGGSFKINCTEKELDEKIKEWNKLSSFFVKEILDLSYTQIGFYLHSEHCEEPSIYEVVNVTEFSRASIKLATISEIVNFLKIY